MYNKRGFLINIISQMMGFLVNFLIGFFISSYIVARIDAAAYGFVGLANDFVGYAQILTVALNSMAGRFIAVELHSNRTDNANRYFTSVTIANIAVSVALLVPFVLIVVFMNKLVNISNDILFDVQLLWATLFINFIISILITTFQVATFAKDKLYLSALVQIAGNLLRLLVLAVTFGLFKPAVWYLGLASLVSTAFCMLSHICLTKRLLPELKIKRKYFHWKSIWTIISSGIWNSLTKMGGIMSSGLDLLITNKFIGAAAMGLVSISKTVPTMLLQLMSAIASVFAPRLVKSFSKYGYDDMAQQAFLSVKLLGIISSIPLAFLLIFGEASFSLWMPSLDAVLLHRLSLISCLSFTFSMPLEGLWNVFSATNKVRITSIYLFLNSVLSVALVFVLLPLTQDTNTKLYIIVGVSSIFSVIRALTFLPIYAAHCLKQKWYVFYPYIFRNLCYTVLLVLLAWGISRLISLNSWIILFAVVCIFSLLSLPIGILLLLKKKEQQAMISIIKKVHLFGKNS